MIWRIHGALCGASGCHSLRRILVTAVEIRDVSQAQKFSLYDCFQYTERAGMIDGVATYEYSSLFVVGNQKKMTEFKGIPKPK